MSQHISLFQVKEPKQLEKFKSVIGMPPRKNKFTMFSATSQNKPSFKKNLQNIFFKNSLRTELRNRSFRAAKRKLVGNQRSATPQHGPEAWLLYSNTLINTTDCTKSESLLAVATHFVAVSPKGEIDLLCGSLQSSSQLNNSIKTSDTLLMETPQQCKAGDRDGHQLPILQFMLVCLQAGQLVWSGNCLTPVQASK